MVRSGPQNTICDVPGIRVGHAQNDALVTGTTVVIPDTPTICAVDQRGGGTGSRDTALLSLGSTVEHVHAITLSGGSAYGLDAAGGVMDGFRRKGIGFTVGTEIVPIVPSAIIFDLLIGGPKSWDHSPYWEMGRLAFANALHHCELGNVGAGLGATAGQLKGGLGSASYQADDLVVAALAVVNPIGSCVIPGTNTFWGWMFEQDGELGGQVPPTGSLSNIDEPTLATPLANTTLAVVATNATLSQSQASRVATMAQDGLARAISPIHGPLDGDTVFVLATGTSDARVGLEGLTQIGTLAAQATTRAIMRGVYAAEPMADFPSYRGSRPPPKSGREG